jgi:transcriptional regulator with XRE-family HTH domain
MITLKDKMKALSATRRARVDARATALIAEEMSLRDLRRAHELTQERMSQVLGIGQESVSRLEKRTDLLLSTLRDYVNAMGGDLRLIAEFPDRPPVALSGLATVETVSNTSRRRAAVPPKRRARAQKIR